jgi:hypothetical protein
MKFWDWFYIVSPGMKSQDLLHYMHVTHGDRWIFSSYLSSFQGNIVVRRCTTGQRCTMKSVVAEGVFSCLQWSGIIQGVWMFFSFQRRSEIQCFWCQNLRAEHCVLYKWAADSFNALLVVQIWLLETSVSPDTRRSWWKATNSDKMNRLRRKHFDETCKKLGFRRPYRV